MRTKDVNKPHQSQTNSGVHASSALLLPAILLHLSDPNACLIRDFIAKLVSSACNLCPPHCSCHKCRQLAEHCQHHMYSYLTSHRWNHFPPLAISSTLNWTLTHVAEGKSVNEWTNGFNKSRLKSLPSFLPAVPLEILKKKRQLFLTSTIG